MIKHIKLGKRIAEIEFVIPEQIREFLHKNSIDEARLFEDKRWEKSIYEDLLDENDRLVHRFKKAVLVIKKVYLSENEEASVKPRDFADGKFIASGSWSQGSFAEDISIGYSMYEKED